MTSLQKTKPSGREGFVPLVYPVLFSGSLNTMIIFWFFNLADL